MSSIFKNTGKRSAPAMKAGKGDATVRRKKARTRQPREKQGQELAQISEQLQTIGDSIQSYTKNVDEFDKGVSKYTREKDDLEVDVAMAKKDPVEAMLAELRRRRGEHVAFGNLATQIEGVKDEYPEDTLIRAMRSGIEQISAMTMEDIREIDAMSKGR